MNKTADMAQLFSEPGMVKARQRLYIGGSLGSCSCEPAAGSRRYIASKWLREQSIGWYHGDYVFVLFGTETLFFFTQIRGGSIMDYGKTLHLPQTEFPMRGNLPKREPDFLKFWQDHDIYKKTLAETGRSA